ncbi:MAG: cation:proton antiporter [archaeon]
MVLDYLSNISLLSLLLLVGVLISIFARNIKVPSLLLLILIGGIIGKFGLAEFDQAFITTLALFALIMIVFDSTAKFKVKEISSLSPYALKLVGMVFLLNLIFLSFATHMLFVGWKLELILLSVLFALMMSGTSASTVLLLFDNAKQKLIKILEFESIINTPFIIIFPLIILYWLQGELMAGQIAFTFLQGIMTGIGTGIVLGYITLRLIKHSYWKNLSPLVVVALALVSYTLAEALGGNGILAVTAVGVIFGITVMKEKEKIESFVSIFSNFLTIVVFILLGIFLVKPVMNDFLLKSLLLFFIYLILRFAAVSLSLQKLKFNLKERIFMTLNMSKGVGEAVIAFVLMATVTSIALPASITVYLSEIVSLTFLFILYSIVITSIAATFVNYFLGSHLKNSLGAKNHIRKSKKKSK